MKGGGGMVKKGKGWDGRGMEGKGRKIVRGL